MRLSSWMFVLIGCCFLNGSASSQGRLPVCSPGKVVTVIASIKSIVQERYVGWVINLTDHKGQCSVDTIEFRTTTIPKSCKAGGKITVSSIKVGTLDDFNIEPVLIDPQNLRCE
jgi:hypothetical protein